jgi:hypothetical protein
MLKFRFKLKINEAIEAKCPRHPRFHPEKEGHNSKNGCSTCPKLWNVYRATLGLERAVGLFYCASGLWIKYRQPRRKKVTAATEPPAAATEPPIV